MRGHRSGTGKGKNFDLCVWTDHINHRGKLQRPIERARTDDSAGFINIEQNRAVFAFLPAVLVRYQRGFDAAALTSAHGQHHIDEGVTTADPGNEYSFGAHGFGKKRGVLCTDLFAVAGFETNSLQHHTRKIQPFPMGRIEFQHQWMILPVPRRRIITAPGSGCIDRHHAVEKLVRMNECRHGVPQRESVVTDTRMYMLRVGDASLHKHYGRKLGISRAEIINGSLCRGQLTGNLREPPRNFALRLLNCAMSVELAKTRQYFAAHYQMRIGAEAGYFRARSGHIEDRASLYCRSGSDRTFVLRCDNHRHP